MPAEAGGLSAVVPHGRVVRVFVWTRELGQRILTFPVTNPSLEQTVRAWLCVQQNTIGFDPVRNAHGGTTLAQTFFAASTWSVHAFFPPNIARVRSHIVIDCFGDLHPVPIGLFHCSWQGSAERECPRKPKELNV